MQIKLHKHDSKFHPQTSKPNWKKDDYRLWIKSKSGQAQGGVFRGKKKKSHPASLGNAPHTQGRDQKHCDHTHDLWPRAYFSVSDTQRRVGVTKKCPAYPQHPLPCPGCISIGHITLTSETEAACIDVPVTPERWTFLPLRLVPGYRATTHFRNFKESWTSFQEAWSLSQAA